MTADPGPLRLLTYNIHKGIDMNRRLRLDRVAELIKHYDADVVLLQEVLVGARAGGYRHQGEELAVACDYPHQVTAVNHRYRHAGGYGNATLSRLPILNSRNLDLTIGGKKRRGCLHTFLDLGRGTGRLRVFNLHLGLSAAERALQVDRLLSFAPLASNQPGQPQFVVGDFNDWRNLLEPRFFAPRGFLCATRHQRRFGLRTFPSYSPVGALDKVFVRGVKTIHKALVSRMRAAQVASDHLPVLVEVEL
jgi:endonuclease/exonuclease/phosphatase family metal-dependent hydrolase